LGGHHFSQTLGTALGDWLADTGELGYEGGALVFGAALLALPGHKSGFCCDINGLENRPLFGKSLM
jgi:hypothetical protein